MMRPTKTIDILCPLCEGRGAPLFTKEKKVFAHCRQCGLIFEDLSARTASDAEFYEKNYYEGLGAQVPVIQETRLSIYDDILRECLSFHKTGRLLDVGSGYGDFLKKAGAAGWEGWGIDPSREAAEIARDFLGSRILNQTLEASDFPENYFDVITLWNVIDCFPDPLGSLKKIQTWLRSGGLLLVRTPNASFHRQIFRFYERFHLLLKKIGWEKEASVFHRSNFNPKSLKTLLKKTGFSAVQIRNGRPTPGDAYQVFSHSLFMEGAKALLYIFSLSIEFLTGGRILTGSNLIVKASKGGPGSKGTPLDVQRRIWAKRVLLHALAVLGYLLGFAFWFKLLGKNREIRILRYHGVNESGRSGVNVRESEFRKQIDFLRSHYPVISLGEAVKILKNWNLPRKGAVALTFDDGYQDNYRVVFPLLRERKIPAAVFLLTGGEGPERVLPHLQEDRPEHSHLLRWEEAREMAAGGVTMGSHGENHIRLTGLPRERAEFEIANSKKKIESQIKRPAQFFSYPYGKFLDFDSQTESLVREAGYEAAFSAAFGTNGTPANLFRLRRIGIEASDTLFTFRAKLNGALAFLSLFDLSWIRKTVRSFDVTFFKEADLQKKEPPFLLVSVDFPPHKDGVSTISREISCRIARGMNPMRVIGPAARGAGEFDAFEPYPVFRVPGYDWGYLRFFPLLIVTPWIVFRHGIRKVFAMNIAYGGILAWALSFLKPLEYLVFAYGYEFEKVKNRPLIRRLYLSIYRRAKGIVTCSGFVKEKLAEFGVEREKIKNLYPGVDTQKYHPREVPEAYLSKRGLKGRKILLSVGRLIERKGQDQVIRALPRIIRSFPDALYCIIGAGPHEKNLRREVDRLNLENYVRFLGRVADEELVLLYNACEVFLMPSREIETGGHIEGFGIVFLEANACARPVIGGRSGGMAEAIQEGVTGFLVDPNRPEEIAEKVIYLLSHPKEAEEMGARGLAWVRKTFHWDHYAQEVYQLLQGLAPVGTCPCQEKL